MDVGAIFGAAVARYREALGLTQAGLAELLGVSDQTISNYETGSKWPRKDSLAALCKALRVRPWQLLADEGEGGALPPDIKSQIGDLARAAGFKVNGR